MSSWKMVSLGSLGSFRNGLNYTKEARERGGLPIVGVKDFQDRVTLETVGLEELDGTQIDCGDTLLNQGDVLFVRSNGNRELIGRSMFVAAQPLRPTTYSGFSIRLRLQSEQAEPRFFAYLFRGSVIRNTLSGQGGGTNISNLNQSILANLIVPLPPLAIQRRIASILGAYDDLIEVNRRRIAVLEEMARCLFDEWFVHFRFPGHEGHTMVETEHGRLPTGWRVERLGSVAEINARTLSSSNPPSTIKYIDIASVTPGRVEQALDLRFADAPGRARRLVRDGSIIWSTVRPNRRSYALMLKPPADLVVSTGFAVLDAIKVPFAYLYMVVTNETFIAYLTGRATGSAYPAVTGRTFGDAPILVPPEHLVADFGKSIEPNLRLTDKLLAAGARLAASRDLLLSRLISGELSVTTAERELETAA